ncbi:uroporphyrinogen-III synthase, partial [Methylobacterium sp. WL9]
MRIWVARPEPGAARTAERLRALGHEPLLAPVLFVVPSEGPRPRGAFDGVLLTSAQGAGLLAAAGLASDVPVFAVGRRTAEA